MGSATLQPFRPETGNTGAEITEAPAPGTVRSTIDWLEGFLPAELDQVCVLDLFRTRAEVDGVPSEPTAPDTACPVEFTQLVSSRGVTFWQYGNVKISACQSGLWHVRVSGQGCRELEAADVVGDWPNFLQFLYTYDFRCTRIDFAIDDAAALVPMAEVAALVRGISRDRNAMRTRAQSTRIYESYNRDGGEGTTYYVGSAQSDTQVRIYNAAQKRNLEGIQWTRVELQLRAERAHEGMKLLASSGDLSSMVGVLRSHVDFLDPDDHQANVSRRRLAPWWETLTQGVARLRLAVVAVQRTVENVVSWLHRQCAPSLGMLLQCPGLGLDMLLTLAVDGERRLSRRHKNMIKDLRYRNSKRGGRMGKNSYVESAISRNRFEITALVDSYRYDLLRAPI